MVATTVSIPHFLSTHMMMAKLYIKFLLLLPFLAKASSTCDEVLGQEVRVSTPNYFYRRMPVTTTTITKNATIICSNITSVAEIDYITEGKVYEQFLRIANSDLPTLPALAFLNFTSISKLFLGGNGIKFVLPRAFSGLITLKELHLNDNELTEVSNGIYNSLHHLEVLNLTNNHIWKVEVFALMGLANLVRLDMKINNITEVENGVFDSLTSLKLLDMSENPLKNISFDGLTNLDKLVLRNTSLKDFGKNLSNFTVTVLDLTRSQFEFVDFDNFPTTALVDLSENKITSLQNCQVSKSKTVILDTNKIRKIDGSFAGLSKLYLSHNDLENLTQLSFNNSQNIEVADLSFNKISTIVKDLFKGLHNLTLLRLDNNKISKIDVVLFQNLNLLQFLNLSNNRIEEFKFGTFNNLLTLKVLDISGNKLLDLHQYTFYSLSNLQELYFDNNQISSLNESDLKKHLPKLRFVSLNQNPWKCQDLVRIEKIVNLLPGSAFDVENVHGIACFTRVTQNSAEDVSKMLQKSLDVAFKNSSFFKFFESFQLPVEHHQVDRLISVEETSSDFNKTVIMCSVVLQLLIVAILLFAVFLIFKFLKKRKVQKRPRSFVSDLELY